MESRHLQRTLRCTGLIAFAIARGFAACIRLTHLRRAVLAAQPCAAGKPAPLPPEADLRRPPGKRPQNRFRGLFGQGAAVAYAVEAGAAGSLRRRRVQPSITRPTPTRSSEPGVGTSLFPLPR